MGRAEQALLFSECLSLSSRNHEEPPFWPRRGLAPQFGSLAATHLLSAMGSFIRPSWPLTLSPGTLLSSLLSGCV